MQRPLPEHPAWNGLLLLAGLAPLLAALLFAPGEGEELLFLGEHWPGGCAFLEATGKPCTTCGMTRSWVHLSRGHVLTAFAYNPAGATLYLWMLLLGPLGLARLVSARARRVALHWRWLVGWVVFYTVVLYLGVWGLRMADILPPPGA